MGLLQNVVARTVSQKWLNDKLLDHACFGHHKMVRFFGRLGANLRAPYTRYGHNLKYGDIAVENASSCGSCPTLKVIVEELGYKNLWALNRGLQLASGHGHTESVDLLISYGADVHDRNDIALNAAVRNLQGETAKALIGKHNADPHAIYQDVAEEACSRGDSVITGLLTDIVSQTPAGSPAFKHRKPINYCY